METFGDLYQWQSQQQVPPCSVPTDNNNNLYNANELVTVQGATIGSPPVKYKPPLSESIFDSLTSTSPTKASLSDSSSTSSASPSKPTSSELCRDFLNGRCGREDCRYKHDTELREIIKTKVCKDYQKSQCMRAQCKYLHLTETEALQYEKTGELPEKKEVKTVPSGPDICRDFLKGLCKRGVKCKYAHPVRTNGISIAPITSIICGKRAYSAISMSAQCEIMDLNDKLKKKLIELRKEVLELTQLNDTLFTENMKLRKDRPSNGSTSVGNVQQPSLLSNGSEP